MAPQQAPNKYVERVQHVYRVSSDSAMVAAKIAAENARAAAASSRTEQAKCECCGLGEESTPRYVKRVQERFCGHFVCGLCAEAVKEEHNRLIVKNKENSSVAAGIEDAVRVHMGVCKQFNCAVRENPLAAAATAMSQLLLRRAVDAPAKKSLRSSGLARSASCMSFIPSQGEY